MICDGTVITFLLFSAAASVNQYLLHEFKQKLNKAAQETYYLNSKQTKTSFTKEADLVGRAGIEPATLRFLLVRLIGWVTPTIGRCLQRLRQLILFRLVLTRKLYQAELPPDRKHRNHTSQLSISHRFSCSLS